MRDIYTTIPIEQIVSLYFSANQKKKISMSEFVSFSSYLQYKLGQNYDVKYDKTDIEYMVEEKGNIFALFGKNIFLIDNTKIDPFLADVSQDFSLKVKDTINKFWQKHPKYNPSQINDYAM